MRLLSVSHLVEDHLFDVNRAGHLFDVFVVVRRAFVCFLDGVKNLVYASLV
jgi:hypothetical protein